MLEVPTKFFVTSGKAISRVTDLNAFDKALLNAGIGEQNIISVSSILPGTIKQVPKKKLPTGALVQCVLAQMRGSEGETISAGIAYAFRKDRQGGYVAEGHGHMNKRAMKEILQWKLEEMAKLRGVELGSIRYKIEELSIPMDHYGACLAAVVYI
ncbi:MAG: arginine decarboxylase, pyruvoyl-dependent [Candidatus Thermoplasmatota archaeon]|nr:arginine decarboxylase, pyruvoyl-dependent [Candidatus Thermoplasmatota archaeon]